MQTRPSGSCRLSVASQKSYNSTVPFPAYTATLQTRPPSSILKSRNFLYAAYAATLQMRPSNPCLTPHASCLTASPSFTIPFPAYSATLKMRPSSSRSPKSRNFTVLYPRVCNRLANAAIKLMTWYPVPQMQLLANAALEHRLLFNEISQLYRPQSHLLCPFYTPRCS